MSLLLTPLQLIHYYCSHTIRLALNESNSRGVVNALAGDDTGPAPSKRGRYLSQSSVPKFCRVSDVYS